MQLNILLGLLPLLALTSAAPHKRQCNKPSGRPGGEGQGGNNFLGNRGGSQSWTRTRTRTRHQGTATSTANGAPTEGSDDAPAPTSTSTGLSNTMGPPTTHAATTSSASQGDPPPPPPPPPDPPATSSATGGGSTGGGSGNGGNAGGAVGLAINGESRTNLASFGGQLSWYYNWAIAPAAIPGMEFVPMIWGETAANQFNGDLGGAKYIMGFNEPDMTLAVGGSDIPAGRAADLHKVWTAKVPAGVQIGSPGVARGGTKWMDDWLNACGGGCRFDFVPYHFYGTNAADLISYTREFYAKYGKPLWLTEWACHDYMTGQICTDAQVREFMRSAIGFFRGEGKDMVARWSYFGAFPNHASTNANGLMNPDGSANDLGKFYASL